jgi:hypothetical protein
MKLTSDHFKGTKGKWRINLQLSSLLASSQETERKLYNANHI